MRAVPRACIVCRGPATAKRCASCEGVYQRVRNRLPKRAAYRDPAYRAMVPIGLCHWCKERPATTRDHLVPLSRGGTNRADNIVGACRECNSGRGDSGR